MPRIPPALIGEIDRRALGYYLRQERERTILRGVTDAGEGDARRFPFAIAAARLPATADRDPRPGWY